MGLKYFCDFRQLNTNELWRIEIDDPNFSGTATQKLGAHGQTLSINWDGGDSLLSKFAIGSTATITLIFDNISEVKQFQLISDNTWKVRIYKSGVLNWQGYLISDGVQAPDSGVGFPITLTAVDGIDSGSSKPFVNAEVGAVTVGSVAGKINSPLNWIRKCLVNNPLPIRWSSSIKNIQYIDDDFFAGRTGFIPDYDVFISSREETTTLWMLENIVKSVSAVIYQANGYWNIVSLKDIAQSSTLTFYAIDATLNAQTATSSSINLELTYPTPINESTVIMTQKPISKVKATYEHSMTTNIIPNGGFDILDEDNKPVYWVGSSTSILIEDDVPINNRIEGRSARFYNLGTDEHYVTFSVDGINSIPLDANLLFKEMEWGFTFMPVDWAVDIDGFIDWTNAPLQVSVGYTGYEDGQLKRFYLNQFGFWDGRGLDADILQIDDISYPDDVTYIITFSGTPEDWQVFKFIYFNPVLSKIIKSDVSIETGWNFADALSGIASATGGTVVGSTIVYEFPYIVDNFSASFNDGLQNAPRISFTVEDMKNLDVATVSFQSKGNQGRVLFPNPRVLDQMRALDSGKLSIMIVVQPSQQFVFDDLYMNVSSDKEYWDITDGGNDGLENYELGVSSSFSGFMTSSYMDNFATSDLSMIMSNGVDTGTLTEIFGKTALRMLSTPISKVDVEFAGAYSMFNIIKRGSDKFLPLTVTVNPETNATSITMFELKYNSALALTSTHKSTGTGNSVGGSGGSFGGGGGGGGDATLLSDLLDVNIYDPQLGDALFYNPASLKWENITTNDFIKDDGGTYTLNIVGDKVDLYPDEKIVVKTDGLADFSNAQWYIPTVAQIPASGKATMWIGSLSGIGDTTSNGTVTSVGVTVPTGLLVSGSPITSAGTIAITLGSGYVIPSGSDVAKGVEAWGWGNWATQGFITGITGSMVTTALGYTPVNKSGDIMTGGIMFYNHGYNSVFVDIQSTERLQKWQYIAYPDTYNLELKLTNPVGGVIDYRYTLRNNGSTYTDFLKFDRGIVYVTKLLPSTLVLPSSAPSISSGQSAMWIGSLSGIGDTTSNGTVTSVGVTVPTGLLVSGSPITSAGTIAITLGSGYVIPSGSDVAKGVEAWGWGNWATQGFITGITGSMVTTALGYTPVNKAGDTMSGGLTISANTANTAFLDINSPNRLQKWSYSASPSNYYLNLSLDNPVGGVVEYNFTIRNNATTYTNFLKFDRGVVYANKVVPSTLVLPTSAPSLSSGQSAMWIGNLSGISTVYKGVDTFNGRYGAVTLTSLDVTTALGGTPIYTTGGTISGTGNPLRVISTNNSLTLGVGYLSVHGYIGGQGNALSAYSNNGGYVQLNASSAWVAASDFNKKKDIQVYTQGLDAILGLEPKLFRYKTQAETDRLNVGFIAQEVEQHIPEAYNENGDFIGLDYNALIPALVNSIKELNNKILTLQNGCG